ncbi:MAG: hypothetical protein R3E68_09750 [Burkholderiaceae bacterium]
MTAPRTNTAVAPAAERGISANDEKERLEAMLKGAKSKQDIAAMLEKEGWRISSVNEDDGDEVEYEIVNGDRTYEVEAEFARNGVGLQEVDVKANLWRASSTKRMMSDPNYRHAGPLAATPESRRYSDARYQQAWTDEKEKLEQALGTNQTPDQYRAKLEQMGYTISSVNERERDHVEYEIVKGDQSYEVQIEMNPQTKLGTSVDVSTNMWETEATERLKK